MRYNVSMVYRLIDKIIIMGLSVTALFLLFGTSSDGKSLLQKNEFTIASILLIVIVCLTTEVLRNQYVSAGLLLVTAALTFVVPETVTALPASVYGIFSDKKMEDLVGKFYIEKAAKNPDWSLSSQRALWMKVLLLIAAAILSLRSYMIVLVLAALLMSSKTIFMHGSEKFLTDKFDDVRYDAQQSLRLKNEIANNLDMQVRNATLQERNRIAREIHDNVGHMLTRAIVQLQAISVINKDEKTRPLLESVSSTVNEAMTNIRRSVHELHDDSIDLSIGIHEIASALKERFDVTVSTSIESPVPNDVKSAILGIMKEGVTNISKHSKGTKVRLEVVENVTFWRILISDDGKCEKVEYSRPSDFAALEGEHGIGLYNINSRAVSCGGRTSIRGGEDGFHITVTIPRRDLPAKEEEK
ncbi:MAG: hypothetical protein IK020_08900 [Clostridiales bacterium]|nr:hypothetical protein [Clostridiales bacterium]